MRATISCSYAHPLSFINSCSPRLTVKLLYPTVGTQRALLIMSPFHYPYSLRLNNRKGW